MADVSSGSCISVVKFLESMLEAGLMYSYSTF